MSAVVDSLISWASIKGNSEDPSVYLFFARGAWTTGVSSSSDVSSVCRLSVLNAERKNLSGEGAVFLVRLVPWWA
jgi:hypothetical protein